MATQKKSVGKMKKELQDCYFYYYSKCREVYSAVFLFVMA